MIEFVLLFALGFFAAAMLGLLLAPVVLKRIVRFAEDRLKATMPLSPQEVRAQKDMARAFFAAETARATQAVKTEREKNIALTLRQDEVASEARRLVSENGELHSQIADMNVEAADMRSTIRRVEQHLDRLKMTLTSAERDDMSKSGQINTLVKRIDRASADFDTMKIDLATRDTEIENIKSRMTMLREERDALRTEMKTTGQRSRELEVRLMRTETKVRQLETKLGKAAATLADKENFIERRLSDISRLKTRLKASASDAREAQRALLAAGLPVPAKHALSEVDETSGTEPETETPPQPAEAGALAHIDIADLTDEVRNQATALAERLVRERSSAGDDALRGELADIAAKMIALTAAGEGDGSPILPLLKDLTSKPNGRVSLAARADAMIGSEETA
ncbi:hypothetical protein [Pararhizobium sp.]|uniref:hypothetical protein n=1 Tax=Pararhizobium sp. TaxID=1977563 RepID=UPI0027275CB8|nr:hypothetical protein [Pararhizobium sp.]MDO9415087.1 hypothetical protein [Pararhizobium sp.]